MRKTILLLNIFIALSLFSCKQQDKKESIKETETIAVKKRNEPKNKS